MVCQPLRREDIHAYNMENGTDFAVPKKYPDEDSNIDLEAHDEQSGCALYIQVRVSDSRPWEKLKQGKTYVVMEDEQSAFDELWKGIEEKQIQCCDAVERKTLILLLDGWPPLPPSSREKCKRAFAERLSTVGFHEIGLVLREPTRSATRLYP